ncbi:hypothetical protein As57867_003998, partial [Aphanomyces stellatus]
MLQISNRYVLSGPIRTILDRAASPVVDNMSLGNLIPLGKKVEKTKSDDLTGGLISIGAKAPAAAAEMDDFDLDDLLSDTPKSSKKGASSPKKDKKPKEKKKKKKKDKLSSFDDDDDEDGDTSPKRERPTFKFDDDEPRVIPKPKTSMKNLDEEFAKALGFDESEFLSGGDESLASPTARDASPPRFDASSPSFDTSASPFDSLKRETKKEDPKDSEPDGGGGFGGLSASFFDEPDSAAASAPPVTSSSREFGDRPKGRGRRSSVNDASDDPLAKPMVDMVGKRIGDPFSTNSSRRGSDPTTVPDRWNRDDEDESNKVVQESKPDMVEDKGGRRGGRRGDKPKDDDNSKDTPTFPWMKKEAATPASTPVEDDTPAFPWMKKAKDEPVAKTVESKSTEPKDDLPSFPWVKKTKAAADEAKQPPVPESQDMPVFPWTKKPQEQMMTPEKSMPPEKPTPVNIAVDNLEETRPEPRSSLGRVLQHVDEETPTTVSPPAAAPP